METRVGRAPGPRALPVLGGVLQLRGDPLERIVALRAKHGGFIRLGPLGPRELFLVTDPAAVRRVLLDNHTNYKKGLAAQRLRPVLGQGSLLLEGDEWRRRRRLVQPALHKQKIAAYVSTFVAHTDAMLERWRSAASSSLDAREEMLKLTMGLTLRNMFCADAMELRPLIDAWRLLYDELTRSRVRVLRMPAWIPSRRRDATAAAIATMRRLLDGLIRQRASIDDGSVLAMLLRSRDEEGGGGLSETELRDELMTIFVGGYENSSNALAFTLALLAAHPTVAARHREEVDRALQGRTPEPTDLPALPYTRAVLEEAMRLFPPSWMITREALADDVVAGYQVPGGSQLLISAYGLHHAPELWPEPDRFRPERFQPDSAEARNRDRFAYLPFGGGPRICLGEQYALVEMTCVLTRLVQKATLELAPGTRIEAQANVGLRPRYPLRIVPAWR
jgi:cytochrome P450